MTQKTFRNSDAKAGAHGWRFFRAGGFDQVCIDSGADMLALDRLDQKLWVALSCPARGIEFDARTLALIDADGDGHVRAAEIIAAVKWAGAMLKDANLLVQGLDALPLSAINDESEEGKHLLAAARHILGGAGRQDADAICVADMADAQKLVAAMRFNGDGVIAPQSVEDVALKSVVEDIMACCGSQPDLCGEAGITAEIVEKFFAQAEAYANWWKQAEGDAAVWFVGEGSQEAAEAWRAVRAKVDDYFTRCRMAAYDARAAAPLSRSVEDYQSLAAQELGGATAALAAFPLAVVAADKHLPLHDGINPAWAGAMQALREKVIVPLYGNKKTLAAEDWDALGAKFSAMETWRAGKPQTEVEKLGIARVRAILDDGCREAIDALIAQDKALEAEVSAIASVEKLVHYCRDLHTLVNNFVSFRNFYTGAGRAVFQAGTLYLDGRSCELCVRVDDVNKHAVLAGLSRVCLVYCECVRGAEKMFIAAAVTAGDSDQLMAGRNGVFYDRKGQDWDATVVRILEHPISIRQAFWMPYKRAAKMIGEQVQKLAAAKSQSSEDKMVKAAMDAAARKPDEPPKPPAPPFDVAKFAGIFAAIGLAVGALGTAVASVVTGLLGLKWWQLPFAVAGLLLAVSGPAMLIAWFKLKQRNLGPILDANGWAVNARARINIPFGASLTALARLPEGAERQLADPYADKKRVWPYYLAVALLAAGLLGAAWLLSGR